MIRASTGNAVMLIAIPMNSANGVKLEFGVASVGKRVNDSPAPRRNGTMMLA